MLPKCLIGNCNRHIVLFDDEPVDGKYVIIVRNKTTTTNSVMAEMCSEISGYGDCLTKLVSPCSRCF